MLYLHIEVPVVPDKLSLRYQISNCLSTEHNFGDPVKALWFTCSQNLLIYLAFQTFDFERT